MAEPTSDKHYEEKYENPLWKIIKERAHQKDISYRAAADEVLPEYQKTIRYRDKELEDEPIKKRAKEMAALREREKAN